MKTSLPSLRDVRHLYTPDATRAKVALLTRACASAPRSLAALVRLHEDLLFVLAFPDDANVRALALDGLAHVSARLRRFPPRIRRRADDSGMAGSTSRHHYEHAIAAWLADRFPDEVEIDWTAEGTAGRLDALLGSHVMHAEEDAVTCDDVSTRAWVAAAAGKRWRSHLAWLLAQAPRHNKQNSARAFALQYDAAEIPVRWRLSRSSGSVTHCAVRSTTPVFRHDMRTAPQSPREAIASPLGTIRRLGEGEAAELIDVARAALAARCREVFPISNANPDEVWFADLGCGSGLAIFGARPDCRMSLETNTGYLLLSNGVPIGYGGVTPLFHQANTGINIFEPFRRSEAAFIWTQALRAFHSLYGVTRFVVDGYQVGRENPEAIQSGAFWFYYRLGFRPSDARTRRLAASEAARLAAGTRRRSAPATLRALAMSDLHLTLPGFPAGAFFDERWLVAAAMRVTRLLAGESARTRDSAMATISARVADVLGARQGGWPAAERLAFRDLAPLAALLPGLERWPARDRARLVTLLRAKGRPQERDFVLASQAAPRFFRELGALVRHDEYPPRNLKSTNGYTNS